MQLGPLHVPGPEPNEEPDMRSASIEDYIKAIYRLETDHQRATTQRIARLLGVRMASVTGMVKHLAAEGYVKHKPYHGARLTAEGRAVALNLIRRHRLIELFLHDILGMAWDEVHDDAEILEHAMSDRLIERIYTFLGQPDTDPHGAPIPRADGSFTPLTGIPLNTLTPGQSARVTYVSDKDSQFLRYVSSLGLTIGRSFQLVSCAPFEGPLTLDVNGKQVILGSEAGRRILVSPETDGETSARDDRTGAH